MNPNARPAAVLARGIGQLSQIDVLLDAISCAIPENGINAPRVAAAVQHRTQQAQQAMEAALSRLG